MILPYQIVQPKTACGEARFTQDIDNVAAFELQHIPGLMAAFPSAEFCINQTAIEDAIRPSFQFHVIHPASGNKIDFTLPRADAWANVPVGGRTQDE